jgi:hypothetical protein
MSMPEMKTDHTKNGEFSLETENITQFWKVLNNYQFFPFQNVFLNRNHLQIYLSSFKGYGGS